MNPHQVAAEQLGLAHLWSQGDVVGHAVVLWLLLMSVATWFHILAKAWQHWRMHSGAGLEVFWAARAWDEGVAHLRRGGVVYAVLAEQAATAAAHYDHHAAASAGSLGGVLDRGEFLTRALRLALGRGQARLESGMTVLASVGATAPFVGLFGTVWGIYHALLKISVTGSASLASVAGPVGEALIMTAAGLAVAIPAVLAYNAFTRANRVAMAAMDAFAHDLFAYFTTGRRMAATSGTGATLPAHLASQAGAA